MKDIKLDCRAYPINEPQGSTLAFASVTIDDLIAIHGVRVIAGEKGNFVSMPQSKDKDGNYHDIAFPVNGDLRKAINKQVLQAYGKAMTAEREPKIADKVNSYAAKSAEQPARSAAKSRNESAL
ncbi:hypothetical protein FACS1894120_1140 [Clostridia bacterium]|nr:hypothetical protein FACS1894120_1140 [Clostridia bacterium]